MTLLAFCLFVVLVAMICIAHERITTLRDRVKRLEEERKP